MRLWKKIGAPRSLNPLRRSRERARSRFRWLETVQGRSQASGPINPKGVVLQARAAAVTAQFLAKRSRLRPGLRSLLCESETEASKSRTRLVEVERTRVDVQSIPRNAVAIGPGRPRFWAESLEGRDVGRWAVIVASEKRLSNPNISGFQECKTRSTLSKEPAKRH